jgi:hypothetical protein
MKRGNASRTWILAALALAPALPLLAADAGVKLEPPAKEQKNRFGLAYRAGFNFTAEFKNVGNVARGGGAGRDPGPATGGDVDRFYDDGYNRVDISGNSSGLTWFWGYDNASQIPGDDTLRLSTTTARPIDGDDHDDDPQHGFELTWDRELGRATSGKWAWGLEGAFGWTDVEVRDHRPLAGGVTTLTDAFNLSGVVPPPPGYRGDFEGPGPLIDSTPNRTITSDPNGAVVRGTRDFDGDLFSFRAGPYLDIPLDERWTISMSAGFAAGVVQGVYRFEQTVTTVGGTTAQRGTGRNTDVLFGGYASGSIHCQITERWGAFVNGQYLGLADGYEVSARGQKMEMDFTKTAFFSAGVTFSF